MAEVLVPLSSIEYLSKQWLEEMLSYKCGYRVTVTTWSVKIPEKKDGFLSEVGFVKVSFMPNEYAGNTKYKTGGRSEDTNTATENGECVPLVVKLFPKKPVVLEMMRNSELGRREVEFYKYAGLEEFRTFCFRSGLPHPVPEVYWANLKNDALTIVLHDLTSDGFCMMTPVEGNSLDQIMSTLRSIAIIHVAGIAYIMQHGQHAFDIPFNHSSVVDYIKAGLDIEIKMFTGTPTAATLSALLSHALDLVGVAAKYPLLDTVIHGDLWTGNVMFSKDNTFASIIDWQFAMIGNPVCDILTLLFASAEPSAYQEHLPKLLECYWQSFDEALKKNNIPVSISLEQLSKNVDDLWIYGYMFITASLDDFLNNNKISETRVKKIIAFMEEKGHFARFLSDK